MNKWMIGALAVVMPCMAWAADKQGGAQQANINAKFDQLFRAVDANGDGKLSKEEAEQKAPAMAESFDAIDTNRDGGLSKQEIKAFTAELEKRRREFGQRLEKADKDKNGMLSREEAKALPNLSTHFDEIDSNRDGQLVIKEISDYLRARIDASSASSQAPAMAAQ